MLTGRTPVGPDSLARRLVRLIRPQSRDPPNSLMGEDPSSPRAFYNSKLRVPVICAGSAMLAVCATLLGGARGIGGWSAAGVTVAMSASFLYRGTRCATILIGPSGVIVRRFVRTSRFRWDEIESFDTQRRVSGAGRPGVSLVLHLTSGGTFRDGEFFSPKPFNFDRPTATDAIAIELNEELRVRRL